MVGVQLSARTCRDYLLSVLLDGNDDHENTYGESWEWTHVYRPA